MSRNPTPFHHRHRTALVVLLLVLALGVVVRALLPTVVETVIDRSLDRADGYRGSVRDVDLALLRGAYRIEGLELHQVEGDVERPLLSIPAMDLSVQWRALLDGALVADVVVEAPRYQVVAARPSRDPALAQSGRSVDWPERIGALFPLHINRFEIRDGRFSFHDPHRSPEVAIALEDIDAVGTNWSNVRRPEQERPALLAARARAFDSGRLELGLRADPLAPEPDFGLDLRVRDIDLRELDDFLQAYASVEASAGTLHLFSEVDASGGRFEGYLKPLLRGLDVAGPEDSESVWNAAWESFVGALAEVFENQPADQQGARIPIEGRFADPEVGIWAALASVLENAFLDALPMGLERQRGRGPDGSSP